MSTPTGPGRPYTTSGLLRDRSATFGGVDDTADEPVEEDGRRYRRQRNRASVVDALLDLYRDGNLRPSSTEIAERAGLSSRSLFRYFDDVDDLMRSAVRRQQQRALPLLTIDAGVDAPLHVRATALVEQRFRLFDAVAPAATVSRLQAPFQSTIASELAQGRAYLRAQLVELFGAELAAMGTPRSSLALAALDVVTSFESFQLLCNDQALATHRAKAAMAGAVEALLVTGEMGEAAAGFVAGSGGSDGDGGSDGGGGTAGGGDGDREGPS